MVAAHNVRKLLTKKNALDFVDFLEKEVIRADVYLLSETNMNSQDVLEVFTDKFRVAHSPFSTKGGTMILVRKDARLNASNKIQIKACMNNSTCVLLR